MLIRFSPHLRGGSPLLQAGEEPRPPCYALAPVILVRQLKLLATPEQRAALLATTRAMNAASSAAARAAFDAGIFRKYDIQKLVYQRIRAEHRLLSQMAIRAIANVAGSFARDRKVCPTFRDLAAVTYDARILSIKRGVVSISTLDGRLKVPVQAGILTPLRIEHETDLIYRDGDFYLHVGMETDATVPVTPSGFLGVDLGIVNIATDSDGTTHSGAVLNAVRARSANLHKKLQTKGTRSAKRLLKKRRRKESNFARHTNHCISKALVARAKGTGRGIALEDLEGIRDRITVPKAQRRVHHSWGFFQLRSFVTYKALLAGVALDLVDPRNTSRTCPACDHIAKANRKSRDLFQCVVCGHAGPADHIAAINIARRAEAARRDVGDRAEVNRPDASGVVGLEDLHAVSQMQSLVL